MNVASLEKRPIKGYEDLYWIDRMGRVSTIVRKGVKGEYLKNNRHRQGYLYVGLTKNGKRKNYLIHRLLAIAFLSNPLGYKYINHINGRKSDNRLVNLEWCSSSQNNAHAYRTGLKIPSRKVTTPKFSEQQIIKIRNWHLQGYSNSQVAERFAVHRSTIHRIVTNKTLRSV